ncbi:hypothetical protein Csa_012191, partial [Cucumis sativus]
SLITSSGHRTIFFFDHSTEAGISLSNIVAPPIVSGHQPCCHGHLGYQAILGK